MKTLLLFLVFLIQGSSGYRVVCVYTNWAQYRPEGGKFLPEDVDPTLCTHLIYVYAKLQGNKLKPAEWNDDGSAWSEGMYERVNNLKQMNPEMKTLLGVGGWMMGSKDFSRLAGNRIARRLFAKTSAKFLRDRNFDGLTIDWQHPTKRGGKPQDKINYSLLLQEIRKAFEAESKKSGLPRLLLTAGVTASKEIINGAYEVENITKYTDFLNVMAYDLHGAWDNYTGHPSQLYQREEEFGPSTEINVDAAMRYWMSVVPDRSKLNLGISTYGRTFTLRKKRHNDYSVPTTGPGVAGDFTKQPGMIAYYERCSQYADAPRVWDVPSQVAYWYSGDQWIAGEDIESVKAKVNWTRTYEIGGMMIWSLDTDDFTNKCMAQAYPVLNTVVTELNDPTFVKRNISVMFSNSNVTPGTATISKPTEKQTRPDSKTLDKIAITSTTVSPKKQNQQTTFSPIDMKETNLKLTTKADKGQIIMNNVKQQQQQRPKKEINSSLNEQQNQSQKQPQKKVLPKNDSQKKIPKVKRIVKMKVRRRFKHKLRRKVVSSKHKNSNRKKLRNSSTGKNKTKQSKTPTKMEIIDERRGKTAVSGLSKAKKMETKKQDVPVKTSESETKVKNRKENDLNVVRSNQMLREQQTPGGVQENGKAKPHKNENIVNRMILSDAKDTHRKETKQSSIKESIHILHKNGSAQEQRENNETHPMKETGKTFSITSKRKQGLLHKIHREHKESVTTAERPDRGHKNNSTLRKHSVIKEKSPESSNNSKVGVVSSSSSTPSLHSMTVLSSTSSPLKLKVALKRVSKKVRRRKGKVPRKGRRLKRRIKKRPKVSSVKS